MRAMYYRLHGHKLLRCARAYEMDTEIHPRMVWGMRPWKKDYSSVLCYDILWENMNVWKQEGRTNHNASSLLCGCVLLVVCWSNNCTPWRRCCALYGYTNSLCFFFRLNFIGRVNNKLWKIKKCVHLSWPNIRKLKTKKTADEQKFLSHFHQH